MDDLDLAGGFAGEIQRAVEMPGTQLAEREFEQDSGFAKSSGCFEQHGRVTFECSCEINQGGFLTLPWFGKGRPKAQTFESFASAQSQIEKLNHLFKLCALSGFV